MNALTQPLSSRDPSDKQGLFPGPQVTRPHPRNAGKTQTPGDPPARSPATSRPIQVADRNKELSDEQPRGLVLFSSDETTEKSHSCITADF